VDRTLPSAGGGLYLLAGPTYEPIAGNILGGWPQGGVMNGDWMRFQFGRREFGDPSPYWADAKIVILPDGIACSSGAASSPSFRRPSSTPSPPRWC
jgi:hypothetical protein